LALSCHRCNQRHYNFTTGIEPLSEETVLLFNPRQQHWSAHFTWADKGLRIVGVTDVGRATCDRFDFNDDHHDDGAIRDARWFWIQGRWHPPMDDPIQAE
jgi:hypothetical protein